ncbi:hypothetical protein AB1L05_12400 [Cytobacillus horneckiae]|uniref:hypothetical protein n=1 Tax=Cytobacillus horneckiae TaxID=549687 RepID=UPI00203F79C2|nr:hypothetical protein [Cytobacillus horneckiae]MCM3179560.1 hypothetical protein [Cytobacillus horneckiae]
MNKYEKLINQYLHRNNQLTFTKEEVINRIISKFKAREYPKEEVLDLVNDDQLEYSKIFTCLVIDDPFVLAKLFTSNEKSYHNEQLKDNRENPLNPSKVKKNEWNYNHMILDEQEGRRIDIILESKDDLYITEFIVRDRSEVLSGYLNALIVGALLQSGMAEYPADISNEYFQFYLDNLEKFGFLN